MLYNAALEERIGAYRRGVRVSYFDQAKGLTEWRRSDSEARSVPVAVQRATLKRLDDAYRAFFHLHRQMPLDCPIRCCTCRRDAKGWKIGFVVDGADGRIRPGRRCVGVDLGISKFAALGRRADENPAQRSRVATLERPVFVQISCTRRARVWFVTTM